MTRNNSKLESLWIEIINKEAKSDTPKLHSIGENIYMWIFSFKEKNYVFGPVCTNQVTLLQVHKLVHQYHLNDEKHQSITIFGTSVVESD